MLFLLFTHFVWINRLHLPCFYMKRGERGMTMVAISMRKLKAILQLKYEAKLSHRQIARSLSISPSTVSTYANRARQSGLCSWPLSVDWDDKRLSNAFGQTTVTFRSTPALPNWQAIHQELKRKGVTQQLLWQEYAERYPDNHYSYTHFCREYRLWRTPPTQEASCWPGRHKGPRCNPRARTR